LRQLCQLVILSEAKDLAFEHCIGLQACTVRKLDCHPEEGFSPTKDPQRAFVGKPAGSFSTRIISDWVEQAFSPALKQQKEKGFSP